VSTSRGGYHHGGLRAALIAAGLELLREVGPADLSLRAAARRAGVSAMAPYRHFADKEALLAALATEGFTRFGAALASATASAGEPGAALGAQGIAYVRFALSEPALFRLMFGPVIRHAPEGQETEGQGALRAAGEPAFEQLRRAVAAAAPGRTPDSAEAFAMACWSMVHGYACLVVDGKIPWPDDLDRVLEPMLGFLLPPEA
jgi:AcrR family transcriptional regulator